MRILFLWFYCLPTPVAVAVVVLTTGTFLYLRVKYGGRLFWQVGVFSMLLLWGWIVAHQTALGRTIGVSQTPILNPFQSYIDVLKGGNREILRSQFMNVILFYPIGLLLAALFPKRWPLVVKALTAFAVGIWFSWNIEYYQYCFSVGVPQVDDVIHNTGGAVLGSLATNVDIMVALKKLKCLKEYFRFHKKM